MLCLSGALGLSAPAQTVVDASFDPGAGANNDVFALALQADGKILVGGQFRTFNGTNRSRIARLNADGSLDLSFDPGLGANGDVYAVALQPDGKVVIGGAFTDVNGVTNLYAARLLTNGAVDTSFAAGAAINNELRAIVVQPDGKVVI
ncbi:MAG TPA: delta-60 repeat domain-containing protein, partial [Verrucomicrobiae bacterium]